MSVNQLYSTTAKQRNVVILSLVSAVLLICSFQTSTKKSSHDNNHASYIAPQMAYVGPGSFTMGCNTRNEKDEQPEHLVHLSGFWMGKYEVTVAEFRKFMNTHTYITDAQKDAYSYTFDGKTLIFAKDSVNWECDVMGYKRVNEEDHPVIHVSQKDAQAYCAWLSKQTGKTYRLPTEAEWEYAAKGGPLHENFTYSGGNDMEKLGWYAWNSDFVTHPVGKKKPNGLGLYDMCGNAWEWCSDKYGPYFPAEQTNPTGCDTGSFVVLRGGGWRYYVINTRCTSRRAMPPAFNGSGPGFRVVCEEGKK